MPAVNYIAVMSGHDHDHSELSETELRVRALETILTEKGYVEPAALDLLIETYEKKIGPRNGATREGCLARYSDRFGRPGFPRALGSARFRDRAGLAQARAVQLEGMGGDARR